MPTWFADWYELRSVRYTEPIFGVAVLEEVLGQGEGGFMPGLGGPPASFLAPGCSWMDDRVTFVVDADQRPLRQACETVWELSARVRSARGRRGWSMEQLAFSSGVRRQTIADIENGRAWPDTATIVRLLEPLGWKLAVERIG